MAWWWKVLTCSRRRRVMRCSGEPATSGVTAWVRLVRGVGLAVSRDVLVQRPAARRRSAPACRGRRRAPGGRAHARPRAGAARSSSAARSMFGPSCGSGLAVGAGVEVRTAAEEHAVEALEQGVRVVARSRARAARRRSRRPRGRRARRSAGGSAGRRARPLVTAARQAPRRGRLREELVRDDADEGWTWRARLGEVRPVRSRYMCSRSQKAPLERRARRRRRARTRNRRRRTRRGRRHSLLGRSGSRPGTGAARAREIARVQVEPNASASPARERRRISRRRSASWARTCRTLTGTRAAAPRTRRGPRPCRGWCAARPGCARPHVRVGLRQPRRMGLRERGAHVCADDQHGDASPATPCPSVPGTSRR